MLQSTSTLGQTIILPHVSSLTHDQVLNVNAFIKRGNTLIATGLTRFYNAKGQVMPLQDFPLSSTLGGAFKEVKCRGDNSSIHISDLKLDLPAHLFVSEIDAHEGTPFARTGERIHAMQNHHGKGHVTWIPSLIGLAAWKGDRRPLSQLLQILVSDTLNHSLFRFEQEQPAVVLRVLSHGNRYATILTSVVSD